MRHSILLFPLIITFVVFSGCSKTRTSDTPRTGIEQLLISNAVDQTLSKTELPDVNGKKVFLEDKYLDGVDKNYVVGSLRQKLLVMGASLVDKKEDSEITIEVCSGGIGTDNFESFLGMPGLTVPGLPVELPEVRIYERNSQFGTAKISLVAYDTKSGSLLHDSGSVIARADNSRWNVLGVGPFQSGTVREEVLNSTGEVDFTARVANTITFDNKTR